MKHYLLLFAVLLLSACNISSSGSPPPTDSLPENSFADRPALDPSPALNLLTGEETGPAAGQGCRSSQPLGSSLAELVRNVNHSEELQDNNHFSDTFLDWMLGGGIGRTALNVTTVVVFPPFALYLLGNAGIALAGYDPLYVTDALPDSARTGVLSAYNEVTSVPGRINAAVMREKFCPPPAPAAVRPPARPVLVSVPQQEGQ